MQPIFIFGIYRMIYIWIILYGAMFRAFNGAYLAIGLVVYTIVLFSYLKKRGLLLAYGILRPHMSIKLFLIFNIPVIVSVGMVSYMNLRESQHTYDLSVITQIIICAFVEEIFFRGWLSRIYKNLSFIIISSILFAGAHMINCLNGAALDYTFLQSLWAFGMGLCFAILRVTCRSIWPGTIYHVIINGAAIGTVNQVSYGHVIVTLVTFICAFIMLTMYYLYSRRLR